MAAIALVLCCVGIPLIIFVGMAIANFVNKQRGKNPSGPEQDHIHPAARNGKGLRK